MMLPVVLAGGAGARLWPASVSLYPKQLLPLVDGTSTMLQDTVKRLDGMDNVADEVIVVCNEAHRFLVAEQLREIDRSARIVLEPEGRNTAPAVAVAAFLALEIVGNAVLLVMPADHVIRDVPAFRAALELGLPPARDAKLVTFGIAPTRAETGYGYIKAKPRGAAAVPVELFVEKPDIETAQKYVDGGEYFWNSGMFLFRAQVYLDSLRDFAPDIFANCLESLEKGQTGTDCVRPDATAFLASPSDSIDNAVIEKTDAAMMVPLEAGWSDVGSWAALHEVRERDEFGNTIDGDVVTYDCRNSFIQAEDKLVAAVGLDDVVIVQTKNAILVANKSRSQDVKHIVDDLKRRQREEIKLHRQVFRPWGSYDSLESRSGFQVKRLIVNPGAALSLQKHARRAEHWVIVRGKARITRNDEVFDLGANESTYIATGDVHRIANPFDEPVHIIEVQCGDYLGEDDIVRLENNYGRKDTTT